MHPIIYCTVATGFPSGQYSLKTRLEEIRQAVADGASEIDIVINRHLALTGNWQGETVFVLRSIPFLICQVDVLNLCIAHV
jgi:deoxyribose-phosphate aldolase